MITKEDLKQQQLNDYLNLEDEGQYDNEIFLTLSDNGDWEYTRMGFGEDHIGLYLVDLDDSGELLRSKIRINPSLSVGDVLAEGVRRGLLEKVVFEGAPKPVYLVDVHNDSPDWDGLLDWLK